MSPRSRRWFWRSLGLIVVIAAIAGGWLWRLSRRPNILIITLDTTRADRIGCYGHAAAFTPVLDQLAKEGVLFQHAVTSVPLTLPSHATMFTGRQPPEHGLRVNGMGSLPKNIPILPELLRERGYNTGAFVGAFVLDKRFGLARGFDEYDDELNGDVDPSEGTLHRRRSGSVVVDRALNWLESHPWRPFYCWVHLYDPHFPRGEHRDEFQDRFAGRGYDAEIAFADRQIGRVIELLRTSGRLRNTLIVVVGDHGEGLGEHVEIEHGQQLYETTLHVPFIAHWPERWRSPQRVKEAVGLIDLYPTIADCFDLPLPSKTSGRSLRPAMEGLALSPVPLYVETYHPFYSYHAAWQNALIYDGWKYIHSPQPELYHLTDDSRELQNLIGSRPDEAEKLKVLLQELKLQFKTEQAEEVQLGKKERDVLTGLGYTGNVHQAIPAGHDFGDLRDIKTVMEPLRQTDAALELRNSGKWAEAEAELKRISDANPWFNYPKVFYAETLAAHAAGTPRGSAVREQKFGEAEVLCRKLIADNSEIADTESTLTTHMILAGILSETGRFEEANKVYDRAARIDPQMGKLFFDWSLSLEKEGKRDEALKKVQIAVSVDAKLAGAHVRIGEILLQQSRPLALSARAGDRDQFKKLRAQAVESFRRAIEANPRFISAYYKALVVLEEDGKLKDASDLMAAAVQAMPADFTVRYLWAVMLAKQNQPRLAAEQLRLVLQQSPQHPGARELLAECEQQAQK